MEPFKSPNFIENFDNEFSEPEIDIHKAIIQNKTTYLIKLLNLNPNCANERHFFVKSKQRGQVPLYTAVSYENIEAVKILLKHNSNPNIGNSMGETPLHFLADISNHELAELLLNHGADPNIQERDGDTPLHYAAFKGDEEMASLLLENGADPNIKNFKLGRTPLLYAIACKHLQLVKIMIIADGDPFIEDNLKKTGVSLLSGQEKIDLVKENQLFEDSFSFRGKNYELRLDKNFYERNESSLEKLEEWLEKEDLKELLEILVREGYDDIKILENKMKSSQPITDEYLKNIGISKPGLRHRLLVHLDSLCFNLETTTERKENCWLISRFFKKETPSSNRINLDLNLADWLTTLKLTYLVPFFEESGYGTYRDLVSLMNSSRPITDETLSRHVCIRNYEHRMVIMKDLESTQQQDIVMTSLATERKSCLSCNCCIM